MKRTLFAALAAICLSTPAMAVTLTEGTDYVDGPIADLGLFGAGLTTVQGRLQGNCIGVTLPASCNLGPGDPIDRITFDLLPGLVLTDLEIAFGYIEDPGGLTSEIGFEGVGGPVTFSNLLPGIYQINPVSSLNRPFDIYVSGYQANALGSYIIDWSVTATVAAVPLPGAAGLLLAALAATGVAARRRARRQT